MTGEAPDVREQQDCPGADVCQHGCDQHQQPPEVGALAEVERRIEALDPSGYMGPKRDAYEDALRIVREVAAQQSPDPLAERVEELVRELRDPNPEADQDWHDDPVGCIADGLDAALTHAREQQTDGEKS